MVIFVAVDETMSLFTEAELDKNLDVQQVEITPLNADPRFIVIHPAYKNSCSTRCTFGKKRFGVCHALRMPECHTSIPSRYGARTITVRWALTSP